MKKVKNIAIILSILTIGNYFYGDDSENYAIDMQRFYGGPYDAESYVDTNKDISTESYTSNNNLPFPGPQGSYQNYPYPNTQSKQIMFQPSDGSLTNGTLEINNKTAQTTLYSYDHVIIINGTVQAPKLNNQGQYVDRQGNQYVAIGSMNVPLQDASDTNIYYIFGRITNKKSASTSNNAPIQDYNNMNE